MESAASRDWLTVEGAAEWLGVDPEDVELAIAAGQLPALVLGSKVRIHRDAVLGLVGVVAPSSRDSSLPVREIPTLAPPEQESRFTAGILPPGAESEDQPTAELAVATRERRRWVPRPKEVEWQEPLSATADYKISWPESPGGAEHYDGKAGRIRLQREALKVRVGRTRRHPTRENPDREGLTVEIGGYPICEFVATQDGSGFASLIKPDGRKSLKPGETVPALYRRSELRVFRDATGMGFNSMAVIVDPDDYESAVHHAATRKLVKRGVRLEPAEPLR